MQPVIVKKDALFITGVTGDGSKTGEVWGDFESRYNSKPFPKIDEWGYEIRFWDAEKPVPKGMDIHVGFTTDAAIDVDGFVTIELPAAEYAVFDVCVANGYDSGNAAMDKWLADNAMQYKTMTLDGIGYVVEVYNEKFSNSVVEFWIPICRV